jgi:hypothetical protein
MVKACNPNYSESKDQEDPDLRSVQAKEQDPISTNKGWV